MPGLLHVSTTKPPTSPRLPGRIAVLHVDGGLGAHLVGQKQPPWAGSDRWSLGGPRAALEVHSRNHHTFISRTDCSVTAQNQGPAPRSAMIRSITVQCRTRRVSHPHVAMSFLPAIQKTRRPASRNRSTSCGRVRICLSRAMTTRLRVATAGIQSGSRTPSGHSGISLWPACTVSRRAASRPCPVRGRFHQRRSGGDRGRRSRPAPSSGRSRFGGRAVGTTELVAKRLQDGFAS